MQESMRKPLVKHAKIRQLRGEENEEETLKRSQVVASDEKWCAEIENTYDTPRDSK